MDNLSLNITELRTYIEELEKRIKAISMQVTTSTQLTAVKACLEEIKVLIEQYQTSYNNFIENYGAHIEEFEQHKQDYSLLNEQLNSLINKTETLEKNVENNTQNISEHLPEFESLKHQLELLSFDINEQYVTLNSHIEKFNEHKAEFNDLSDGLNLHMENPNAHKSQFDNLSTSIDNLTTNLNEHKQEFDTHKNDFESFKQGTNSSLTNLSQDVESLKTNSPSSAPSTGSQIIAFEDFDYSNDSFCCMNLWQFISPYYFVKAQKSQYLTIEISFDLVHKTTSTITPKFYVYKNNTQYYYEVFTPPDETTHSYSYKFRILLDDIHSTFFVRVIKGSNESSVTNFNITFKGLDIIVNSNDKLVNITCFNNQYFLLTRAEADKCKFAVLEKDALSLDPTNLPHFYAGSASSLDNNSVKIHPRTTADAVLTEDTTYEHSHTITLLNMFSNYQLNKAHRQTNTISGEVANIVARDFYMSNYITKYDYVPYADKTGGHTFVVSRFDGVPQYLFSTMSELEPITYNGEQLTDVYNCCLVKNNNLCYGDPAPEYAGAILWHLDNTCYFYPSVNGDSRVEIGKGRICSAYLQTDGSITVYLNQGSEVYRYRLNKNSSGDYTNAGIEKTFSGITSYDELYDGKSLVAKFKDYEIWESDPE